MLSTRVEAAPHPMIFVTGRTSMIPGEIATFVSNAFQTLQGFMAQAHVTPVGPPLAVYQDWDGKTLNIEVGFPVNAVDLQKATGAIHAGHSPSGGAVRTLHKGSYASLRDTYGKLEAEMAELGQHASGVSWEVYHKGPGMAAEADYETEIFMQLSQPAVAQARGTGK